METTRTPQIYPITNNIAYRLDDLTNAKLMVLSDRYGIPQNEVLARLITVALHIDEIMTPVGVDVTFEKWERIVRHGR